MAVRENYEQICSLLTNQKEEKLCYRKLTDLQKADKQDSFHKEYMSPYRNLNRINYCVFYY